MSAPSECPICLCVITGTNDSTTTNCGHCFHTGCLLKNVMRNGSKCPCCRNEMVAPNETADTNETVSSANDPPQNIQFQIMRVKKVRCQDIVYLVDYNDNVFDYEKYLMSERLTMIGKYNRSERMVIKFMPFQTIRLKKIRCQDIVYLVDSSDNLFDYEEYLMSKKLFIIGKYNRAERIFIEWL